MSGKIVGSVRGQVLHLIYPPLVEGTVDYLTAEFSFSGDWDGLSKWAHFKQGSTIYDVPLTNDAITEDQHLNLRAGTWDVYLHGSGDNRRITTTTVRMKVLPYLDEDGEPLPEVPLTFAEVLDQRAQRIQAVAYAVEAGESARKEAERSRELSEFARVQAEAERTGAEADRASAEAVRASAETARKNAEQDRVSAENSRSSAEDTRKTNEEARQAAEVIREQNEEARVEAEKNRKDGITPHIGDNGNWYLGDTDTGKPSRGETGAGMDITGATVGQIVKITAVDDTGKPTAWEAVDMPISFKPAGRSYLTFSSSNSFTLKVNDATKHWDGTLEYFASDKTWTIWDGTANLSSVDNDDDYVLYLRGTGNTVITGNSENYRWVLTGTNVKCIGNIENLLDYTTVASGEHPTMANSCYEYMFYGCTSLTQAPELPAMTLADYCYYSMFCDCTSLTQAPALPATTLANNCYYHMFRGCTALTQVPELPAMMLADYCYRGMFYNCTSLTKAPALPATTLANSCYMAMFYGCTSLAQAPALPATTLAIRCYYGMFHGCTNLKLSSTRTGEYTQEYRIPSSGDGVAASGALSTMFESTGGTFTGTPEINTTYYPSSNNMIVRETEIATLNGYVDSMIDVAIAEHTSNPLNITGATVGQIAKITAVDGTGKPTAWEAVDVPSGGVELDTTLTQSGKAADAAVVGNRLSALSEEKISLPKDVTGVTQNGTNGQILQTNGDGTTQWVDKTTGGVSDYTELSNKPKINGVELSGDKTSADLKIGAPSDEQVATAVEAWLDAHPEATTTVADGSITEAKLADGAVSAQKAGFLVFSGTSENLFNKETVTPGVKRYQAAPWNILTDEMMCLSDFIPVEPNTVYCRSAKSFEPTGTTVGYQYTFFADADKNFLSSIRHYYGSKSFTTPENCAYIQLNLPIECKDIAMVVKGNTEPSEYVPYREYYRLGEAITIGVNNIESLSAIVEAMPDRSITGAKLADEVTDEIESVDSRINTAAGWNDVRQPTKKLTGRINVFEHTVKGVFDIASDISDKTIVVHGVNYFDTSDMIQGLINFNNGTISPSTTSYYTEHLIPVQPGKALYLNRSNADGVRSYLSVHYYGANQEWLRYELIGGENKYAMFTPEEDVYYIRVSCSDLVDADAEKVCIADVDIGATSYGGYDGNFSIVDNGKTYFGKNVYFPYVGYRIENGVLVGASDTYTVEEITHVDVFDSAATIEVIAPIEEFDKNRLQNVTLKFGRHADTDYVIARIFKSSITGDTITPKVIAITPGGVTMKNYASENDFVFAINAGIFNTDDNSCLGTTISNGVVITDHVTPNLSGAGDTLGVDSNGDFVSIAYDTTTEKMLADGITQAVHGWATIISNYAKTDLDALKETLYPSDGTWGNDYIVTVKHPRTACGQYANGDYMAFLCGGRTTNQSGMTLAEMQDLFVSEGVKFAYNLDGGGSCNGYFYKKETAPYTDNRADPSYIVFD